MTREGLLFAIKPLLWLSLFFSVCFGYGDYRFGRSLKATLGGGAGETSRLKDRINWGGGVEGSRC